MSIETFIKTYYVERKGTGSVKWDGLKDKFSDENLLPLWVADMDFKVPVAVQEALAKRVEHGVFGYSLVEDSYYKAFSQWQKNRHGINIEKDWIRFTTGVVNSFNYLIQTFTEVNDSVIILTPVYYPFFDAVKNNERQLVTSSLKQENETYCIDFEDFEEKIIKNKVKLFLHCSPQNPVGRVWTREELTQLFDICQRHQVKIISDEIHQDFIQPGKKFTSALSVDDSYLTDLFVLTSASKTFNLASLLHSHILIPNEEHRVTYDKYTEKIINNPVSLFGVLATQAAYEEGEEWLDELIQVIEHNYHLLKEEISQSLPKAALAKKEGTYLAWLDLSEYLSKEEMSTILEKQAKIAIDYGEWFEEKSAGFIRINLATKPENIKIAAKQLAKVLNNK